MNTPRCPDCKVAMKEGWIPDATYGAVIQCHWHEGPPEKAKFFGMDAGMKATGVRMMPLQAWRCPDCGLVRSYAFPRKWNRVK